MRQSEKNASHKFNARAKTQKWIFLPWLNPTKLRINQEMNNRWYHRIVSCFKALWVTWIQAQSWCCLEKIISHTETSSLSHVGMFWTEKRRSHSCGVRREDFQNTPKPHGSGYGSNENSACLLDYSVQHAASRYYWARALYSLSWVSVERSVVSLLHTVALNWELSVYIFLPAGSITLPQVF